MWGTRTSFFSCASTNRRHCDQEQRSWRKSPKNCFLGAAGRSCSRQRAQFLHFRLSEEPGQWPYPTEAKTPVTATVDLADTRPTRKVHDFTTIWNNRENPLPFDVGDPEYKRFLDARFHMVRLVAFSESWLWGTDVSVSAGRSAGHGFQGLRSFPRRLLLCSGPSRISVLPTTHRMPWSIQACRSRSNAMPFRSI